MILCTGFSKGSDERFMDFVKQSLVFKLKHTKAHKNKAISSFDSGGSEWGQGGTGGSAVGASGDGGDEMGAGERIPTSSISLV